MARNDAIIKAATESVNDKIVNDAIRHSVFLERFKTQTQNEVLSKLNNEVMPALVDRLEVRLKRIKSLGRDPGPVATRKLKELIAATNAEIKTGIRATRDFTNDELKKFAAYEANWTTDSIQKAMPINIDLTTPNIGSLAAAVARTPMEGRLLRDWWGGLATKAQVALQRDLNLGIVAGDSIQQISRAWRKTLNTTTREATALVRTAVNHVSNTARKVTYEANADVMKGVQIIATLDGRTTFFCMSEDGKVYSLEDVRYPPYHFQCRTTTVPVTKSWKELGIPLEDTTTKTRASMNGQVSSKISYNDWLKKQPKELQNDVLGIGRAKQFRAGKSVTKFVGNNRQTLTLKQLSVADKTGLAPKPAPVKVVPPKPAPKVAKLPEIVKPVSRLTQPDVQSLMAEYDAIKAPFKRVPRLPKSVDLKLSKIKGRLARKGVGLGDTGFFDKRSPSITTDKIVNTTVKTKPVVTDYRSKYSDWTSSLSTAEKDGIEYWSESIYSVKNVREYQAGLRSMPVEIQSKIKAFDSAVSKAPKFKGTVYRGQAVDEIADIQVGKKFSFKNAVSASKDLDVAEEFQSYAMDNPTLFEIRSKSGVDLTKLVIEEYEDQAEVFLRKGTNYKVLSKTRIGDGYKIVLEEL